MDRCELIYEGKAKKIYATDDSDTIISLFKDDLTAFNAQKKGSESGKGALNCKISSKIFKLLEESGVKTHFIKSLDENSMLCKRVKIIPIEVIVRNIAAGSLVKRLGVKSGTTLKSPLVEFCYKVDELGDPFINDEHILILELLDTQEEIESIKAKAREINRVLKSFFDTKNLDLVDFKIEFGKDSSGEIILADEISPDSCRFWDKITKEKLDKDRFREGLGGVKMAYEEILKRVYGSDV